MNHQSLTWPEIDSLAPGPDLDKLVAELVMDWRIEEHAFSDPWWMELCQLPSCSSSAHFIRQVQVDSFKPSVRIFDSWAVITKLAALNYSISLYHTFETEHLPPDKHWVLQLYHKSRPSNRSDGAWFAFASAHDAPLAISRAALKTVVMESTQ